MSESTVRHSTSHDDRDPVHVVISRTTALWEPATSHAAILYARGLIDGHATPVAALDDWAVVADALSPDPEAGGVWFPLTELAWQAGIGSIHPPANGVIEGGDTAATFGPCTPPA